MKTTSYYPVIQVRDVQASARFYIDNLGFTALYDTDWYVHLQSKDDETVNLAILRYDHETVPESGRHLSRGLILNFEVEDVDSWYNRARKADLPILKSLRDEDFGQRHFITQDDDGILIDIIKPIQPTAQHAGEYVEPEAIAV
ncbi:Glyoxalase/Bleomycin resistance protein/dioxygenase domain [hydrothermal vent metagenome]|uniref:Glyoxalase/Bleomycin resistance protein/dioxygenase domain n=1 Tax=hydrothermal vent metagenome TaxID=652676 RepID=A0A3B0T1Y2_9ZZZZ